MNREARAFVESLFGSKPNELFILIWTLSDKSSSWFRDPGKAVLHVESLDGGDVYIGVGLSPADFGPTHRCVSDEVAGIVGFWADFDLKSDAHKKPLPSTIDEALALIPGDFPPTIVVFTGNGIHIWWLFKEPWIFENADERNKASELISRLSTLLQYNSSQHGWAFDRLSDLARVLRVPGTVNKKDPEAPKNVTLHSCTDRRYNPSDFGDYLDRLDIPTPEQQNRGTKEWKQHFADSPLVISANAAIPDDMLAKWMESDMRFRNTWNRQRHDLNDQSQSGYDLALACFGVDAGLSEQQVADLIIHHRRIYGKQQCARLDYFHRTISKAMKKTGAADLPSPAIPLTGAQGSAPPRDGASKTDTQELEKARICDRISGLFGIRILRLLKISGKDPMYLMELEQGRIEIPNAGKLMSQQFMKLAFAAKLGKVIPKFKPKQWEQLAQMMLDACLVEESSDELQFEGLAKIQIARYLSEDPPVTSLEGESISNQSRPLIHDGEITVRASHLQLYINKTYLQNFSVIAVASMIKAIGGKSVRVREGTFMDHDRWALPLADFDPKNYSKHYREDCVNNE